MRKSVHIIPFFLLMIIFNHCRRGLKQTFFHPDSPQTVNWGVDESRTGFSNSTISPPLKLVWKHRPSGGLGRAIGAVDSLIYFGTRDGHVAFLHYRTGKKIKTFNIQKKSSVTCAILGSLLVVALQRDKPSLRVLDLQTQKTIWEYHVGDIEGEPLVHQNTIYIGNTRGHIYALQIESGQVLWENELHIPLYSSLVINHGRLIATADDGRLFCLSLKKGELLWQRKLPGPIHATPVMGEHAVWIGTTQARFFSISTLDGSIQWQFKSEGAVFEKASFVDGSLYFGTTQGFIYCLNAINGEVIWHTQLEGAVGTSPFIGNHHLVLGTLNKQIVILNRHRGEEIWRFSLEHRIRTTPLIWNSVLVVASEDRRVYGFSMLE